MRIVKSFVALAGFGLLSGWLGAERILLEARPSQVTVFTSGSAQVTRTGRITLPAGSLTLATSPLPPTVDLRSLQVSFDAPAGALGLDAVELRKDTGEEPESKGRMSDHARALRAGEDELFALKLELQALDDAILSRSETLEFLAKFRANSAQTVDKEIQAGKLEVETWKTALEMAEQRADKARQDIRDLTAQRRKILFRQEESQARLAELRRKGPRQERALRGMIAVTSTAPQTVDYHVTYNVSGAWWEPSYRAVADRKARSAILDVFGAVRQSSGEDWDNVRLQLSTARPDIGTDVPVLLPWYIRTDYEPGRAAAKDIEKKEATTSSTPSEATPALEASEPPPGAVSAGVATLFTARGAGFIPSDGQYHRIPVTTLTSAVTLEHVAIPKLIPHAFLQAKMANKAAFPLLPGVVEVMVGETYVGRGMMKLTAPGETIRLSLGVDETLKIALSLADDKGDRKRKNDRVAVTNVFSVQATNFGDEEVNLTVLDQLPVSRSSEVTVTYGPEAKKALRGASFPGQLRWELRLPPKKSAGFDFDFTIEYPESMRQALEAGNQDNLEYQIDELEVQQASSNDAAQTNAPAVRYENRVKTNKAPSQRLKF